MSEPFRTVTVGEIETYQRDGVVCLRGALSDEWVSVLREAVDDAEKRYREAQSAGSLMESMLKPTLEHSKLHAMGQLGDMLEAQGIDVLRDSKEEREDAAASEGGSEGQYIVVNNAVLDYPAVQRLALESPLGELAAQLFNARKINFLFDQIFIKQPGASTRTAFHQDWGYFHVDGEQVASFWTAVEPVAHDNGAMGYVRGSHRWELYSPNIFVGQAVAGDAGLPQLPDIEGYESDYDIVYFDVEPGDVIVHDYRLTHGSRGNTSASQTRRAISLRYAGDDATVLRRRSAPEEFPIDPELTDGDPLDGKIYPVVWSKT